MGRKKQDRDFWESATLNNCTFFHYYNRLKELAISMFDWKNVPDTVDIRFLELALFNEGFAVFFKDDVTDEYYGLRSALGGNFNIYNIPKERRAYASNGYNYSLNEKDSVLIYNNYLHTPCHMDIVLYARRLYNIDRTIDVNANAQKTPILIQCDENERLTMKNLYKEYDGNAPVIFGSKNLNTKGLTSISTNAPYVADKLYQLRTQIWNEALTYLGVSNLNVQKKERLLVDEVTRNQGGTVASRYSRLEARRQACDEINRMFGLNMSVDYREDFQDIKGDVGGDTTGSVGEEVE